MNSYITPSNKSCDRHLRFANSDGKVWIVPIRNMHIALSIYQPSGVRGRLLKSLLPYLHWIPLVRKAIKGERVNIRLTPKIEKLLCHTLGVKRFDFSIFEGTPSVHKKMTIQISNNNKILAYCKLSDNKDIKALIRRECIILKLLHNNGIDNIPEPIYCKEIEESDTTIFIQSTIKTTHSKVVHEWSEEHQKFIEELHKKTKKHLPFSESDLAQSLKYLENHLYIIPQRDIIERAISQVRRYFGADEVEFSAYHGDFTPWNIILERGRLFAFDFEYAGMSYPPYLDWFHFSTQSAIFERDIPPTEIIREFRGGRMAHLDIYYTSYLLDIISRYIHREDDNISLDTIRNIQLWINLLRHI